MTDFTQLTDEQLHDAINHHRRQRNITANGVNGIANMHHAKMVKLGETEMAKRISSKMESVELDEAIMQGSKEHLEKLKGMLDKAKPGSSDHSQIRHAISSMFGAEHIPDKHKKMSEEVELDEAKMTDAEVLSAAKALAANGKDPKTQAFGKGLVDFHKKNGSFTPAQVGGLQNIMKNASFQMAKEEVELDELSKDTLNSYWKKAEIARDPLHAKAGRAQTQMIKRIRSGKSIVGYKPKDELTPDETRARRNHINGMIRAARTLYRSEELDPNLNDIFSAEELAHFEAVMNEGKPSGSHYAIGMAAAKKMRNDEPPLEKKTIKKAHEIAKAIAKEN
jgi:hypothetical protein